MDTPNAQSADQDRPAARPDGKLPLVIEIKPGQATQGLVGVFKPEQYEGKSIDELVRNTMDSQNLDDSERGLLRDIEQNLKNGKLLYRGQEVNGPATKYAVKDKTLEGEDIMYVELK